MICHGPSIRCAIRCSLIVGTTGTTKNVVMFELFNMCYLVQSLGDSDMGFHAEQIVNSIESPVQSYIVAKRLTGVYLDDTPSFSSSAGTTFCEVAGSLL